MSVEISVELSGVEALLARYDELDMSTKQGAGLGMVALGKRIVEEIVTHYVPVYTGLTGRSTTGFSPHMIHVLMTEAKSGVLRDSVDSDDVAVIEGDTITVQIWAGGVGSGAEKYAAIQHENLMYRHSVGQAKYVEIPVMMLGADLAPGISKYVQIGLEDAWK